MIWNPWAEIRRLREQVAYRDTVIWQMQPNLNGITAAYLRQMKIIAFLCDRNGLTPDMVQVDDAGTVRLGLPPEAETRGTA